jgi:hypothetical protein
LPMGIHTEGGEPQNSFRLSQSRTKSFLASARMVLCRRAFITPDLTRSCVGNQEFHKIWGKRNVRLIT